MEAIAINTQGLSEATRARVEALEKQLASLECNHPKKHIRYREASNGARLFKLQCSKCGEVFGSWIPHDKVLQKDRCEPINDALQHTYRQNKKELTDAINDLIRQAEDGSWNETYQAHIRSAEWREKANLVLKRCNWTCEGCGKNRATQVHHLSYKNLGNEFLFELVGLCAGCHDSIPNKFTE
jgi:transcription elongation factor Elf1